VLSGDTVVLLTLPIYVLQQPRTVVSDEPGTIEP
jgi:hypothetical protein